MLKNCNCGGEAVVYHRINANTVKCKSCEITIKQSELGKGDAEERWNKAMGVQLMPNGNHDDELIKLRADNSHLKSVNAVLQKTRINDRNETYNQCLESVLESLKRLPGVARTNSVLVQCIYEVESLRKEVQSQ